MKAPMAVAVLVAAVVFPAGARSEERSFERRADGIVGRVQKPAGKPAHIRTSDVPPPAPRDLEDEDEGPLPDPPPVPLEGVVPVAPTLRETRLDQGRAAGDLKVGSTTVLAPPAGKISVVAEPSIGTVGGAQFVSHNWYAARSSDGAGGHWTFIDPAPLAPATGNFAGGFCCDQRVTQDPRRDLVLWYLLYRKTGTSSFDSSGVRVAVARGSAGVASDSWVFHDFVPGDFGPDYATGTWLDFPHLAVSDNYLYFTNNLYRTTDNGYVASVIARIPLDSLEANTPYTADTYATTFGTIGPVSGATSTMFFASAAFTNGIRLYRWPESAHGPTASNVSAPPLVFGSMTCIVIADGTNPCGRATLRTHSGWVNEREVGFMFNAPQDGGPHPYPYVRVSTFDPLTLALVSNPDIYSTEHAYQYPAVAVNARGIPGGAIDAMGGTITPTLVGLVRDMDGGGWETTVVTQSTHGSALWGDYNGVVAHERWPRTWVAVGHRQSGGFANDSSAPVHFSLFREQDRPGSAWVRSDFGADGRSDLVFRNSATGSVYLWSMNGVVPLSVANVAEVPDLDWEIASLADFDGDRRTDMVWRHRPSGATWLWLMDGAAIRSTVPLASGATNYAVRAAADTDGNGTADLFWQETSSGALYRWPMNGGTIGTPALVATVADPAWSIGATGDLDGDGRTDLVWVNTVLGGAVLWSMNGASFTASTIIAPGGMDTHWKLCGAADYDGDGRTDLCWANDLSGAAYAWLMNGSTIVKAQEISASTDPRWTIVAAGDFDGDNRGDVVWRHQDSGDVWLWTMDTSTLRLTKSPARVTTVSDLAWGIVTRP